MIPSKNEKSFLGHKKEIPQSFKEFKYISGHFATNPISECDKTFAVVRDPVDLTLSYIQYMNDFFYKTSSFDEIYKMYKEKNIIDNFCNMNTKFLTGSVDLKKYNSLVTKDIKALAENGWCVEEYSKNIDQVFSEINKNNIILIDFKSSDKYQRISEIYKSEVEDVKTNSSSGVSSETKKKYFSELSEMNKLDMEFYERI
jgi:hypothetical protein